MKTALLLLLALTFKLHAAPIERLRVSESGHFLVTQSGAPVFMLADTAWSLLQQLKREEITGYLEHRRRQGFNAVAFVLYPVGNPELGSGPGNPYGDTPFVRVNKRPDPAQPLVTPGANPSDVGEYDYWDHVDFAVAETKRLGLYAFILPCWGSAVVGDISTGQPGPETIFDAGNARAYGRWLGARYQDEPHISWMLGGDRSAVYEKTGADYRPVFHAMAEGLRAGGAAGGGALISYHPQKAGKQSGDWFHDAAWLGFNSIQLWPETQLATITRDWNATPTKPTWLFEGRYEAYFKNNYRPEQWGEWPCRQQAWQTVFAGAFGHTYGHERVFSFGKDDWDWKKELDAPGARSMTHLAAFMRSLPPAVALTRVPDQSLIAGAEGKAERLKSDRITASRAADGTHAMFYAANGRAFRVRLDKLRGPSLDARWFDPRTGATTAIGRVSITAEREFTPPTSGDGQDWVLVLTADL